MIHDYLDKFVEKYKIDFVIANGENVRHGKGLLKNHYNELVDNGIDVVTLGNHYDGKNELRRYIDFADRVVRPYNLIVDYPGAGTALFEVEGILIRVTNILGSAFMNENVSNPYHSMLQCLAEEEEKAHIHIVDFHAEATGEKVCFGYAFDGKVSAVLGTHTHIQTKDAKILPKGTGYITDVGMTGFADGSLGLDVDSVTRKLFYGEQTKFNVPAEGRGLFSAVVLDIDPIDGCTKEIFPIYYLEDKKYEN